MTEYIDTNISLYLSDFDKYSSIPIKFKSITNRKTGEVVGIPCRRKVDNKQGYYFVDTKEFVEIKSVEDLIIMLKRKEANKMAKKENKSELKITTQPALIVNGPDHMKDSIYNVNDFVHIVTLDNEHHVGRICEITCVWLTLDKSNCFERKDKNIRHSEIYDIYCITKEEAMEELGFGGNER